MKGWRGAVVAVCAALAIAGCDSGPSGPGSLTASLSGEDLGGILMEVRGEGVLGFDGLGDTQVYSAKVAQLQRTHRVVAINPGVGPLRVEIRLADLDVADPVISVVGASTLDDEKRLLGGIEVRIER